MPTGLQIISPDGIQEVDTTTRIGNFIGIISVTSSNETGLQTFDIKPAETVTAFGRFTKGLYDHYPQITITYNTDHTVATVSWNYPTVTWVDNINPKLFKVYGSIYVMVS